MVKVNDTRLSDWQRRQLEFEQQQVETEEKALEQKYHWFSRDTRWFLTVAFSLAAVVLLAIASFIVKMYCYKSIINWLP
jgi:hypothetical protein